MGYERTCPFGLERKRSTTEAAYSSSFSFSTQALLGVHS